ALLLTQVRAYDIVLHLWKFDVARRLSVTRRRRPEKIWPLFSDLEIDPGRIHTLRNRRTPPGIRVDEVMTDIYTANGPGRIPSSREKRIYAAAAASFFDLSPSQCEVYS